ncbi:MAG TPA: hypothetical protein P5309_04580 [Syntrophomonadaceae bacterium]|nr:hypothetical protein [Syntrophomonadaceae bacterium]
MTLDESTNENDRVVEHGGIKVVYDPELEPFLRNAVIDYSWLLKYFIRRGGLSSCQ